MVNGFDQGLFIPSVAFLMDLGLLNKVGKLPLDHLSAL
jgi:hypothetical protein